MAIYGQPKKGQAPCNIKTYWYERDHEMSGKFTNHFAHEWNSTNGVLIKISALTIQVSHGELDVRL